MALKDILVHLDITPRCALRLAMAADLAARHGAHLTGVHVIDIPSANYFYGAAMPFVPANPEEIVDRIRAEATQAAGTGRAGIPRLPEPQRDRGRMADGGGQPAHHGRSACALCRSDRCRPAQSGCATGQRRGDGHDGDDVRAGRCWRSRSPATSPVIGEHVLVAWNASREAARAVNDALPLIAGRQKGDHPGDQSAARAGRTWRRAGGRHRAASGAARA